MAIRRFKRQGYSISSYLLGAGRYRSVHLVLDAEMKPVAVSATNEHEIEKVILVGMGGVVALRPDFRIEVQELAGGRYVVGKVIRLQCFSVRSISTEQPEG